MVKLQGTLKKWGNSYAIRISKKDAERLKIKENEVLLYEVHKTNKGENMMHLFGFHKFNKSTQHMMDEDRDE